MLDRIVDEANAGQLPVLIEEWAGESDERRWLAHALRLDLALLVERPELTVPCLLRRCTWFGEEYPSFGRRVVPPGADAVRALARSWRWTSYLRSLRSPSVPLDGGAIEEYRSGAEGQMWLTADHVGVGQVTWERASGRRITLAPPPVTPPSSWSVDLNLFQLVSPERAWPLPFAPDVTVSLVAVLGDFAIVTTGFWDYDEHVSRTHGFDLGTGEVFFELERATSAAARIGDRLFLEYGGDLAVLTLDGNPVSSHRVVGEGLVAGPDGRFATRTGGVIRIWDPAQLSLRQLPEAYDRGIVAISPDSTRAITGQAVCDAHTGEELFQIAFQGLGNWLEGGPPHNCRALCDDVLVELMPFGYHVWDSTTGEVLVDNPDHQATVRDVVAFAPNGRVHAIMRGGGVTVFDNHSLAILHQSRGVDSWRATLAFSAESATLWWGDEGGPATAIQLSGAGRPPAETARAAQVSDGVVTLEGLALPIDDPYALVSNDGKVVLGWATHYVVS